MHWKKFVDYFGLENTHVIIYERLVESPKRELEQIFDFLGVSREYYPETEIEKRYNQIRFHKHQGVIDWTINAKNCLQHSHLGWLVNLVKRIGLKDLVFSLSLTKKGGYRETLSKSAKFFVLNRYFKEDIKLLSSITSLDLSVWLGN